MWFRSTAFGDDKDRVVIRSNGVHTYFGADCAYLIDKFARGFDHALYVWGADHHGDVARVRGAAQALGFDPAAVEIVIYQWVSFLRGGEPVPMSKRAGTFITLDELIDEVGADAARFHLLMFSNDVTMNFDIEAVKPPVDGQPRLLRAVRARADRLDPAQGRGSGRRAASRRPRRTCRGSSTRASSSCFARSPTSPAEIARAAELRAPHRLTHAAQDLAARFHRFYTECPVLSDDDALTQARLWLCVGTKQVIANLLGLLGVSAPEWMERADA